MDRHRAAHQPLYAEDILANQPPPLARQVTPTELTWRQRLMARLMVHGCSDPGILAFVDRTELVKGDDGKLVRQPALPPSPGEPLTAAEAGRLAGMRKRFAKELEEFPIFQKALHEERQRRPGSTP